MGAHLDFSERSLAKISSQLIVADSRGAILINDDVCHTLTLMHSTCAHSGGRVARYGDDGRCVTIVLLVGANLRSLSGR